ncbi:DUF1877 family protein [Lusitaniella coriacea LEGE 07157]|uniref:DUF1877 family protein n=1 Tax=Lusitaniella coriacea LEGE 07157 TaxID=945747 RepID=A0A8J7JB43_9CYAN|nr:DUF1877 family protein [Lusitaniella coriacea]MBE9116740.1 DUF1877 family protein [Lusitaniella coriacea LEGE 07157]
MSTYCYFQQISPKVIIKLQIHPSVVDLFQDAHTLKEYSDNYWSGIESLQEDWEFVDEDLGEQERITPEIYEQISSDIPEIIEAGLVEDCWIGSTDSFDWLENEGLVGADIGNDGYYSYLSYLTPKQVEIMTEKLQKFQQQNYIKVYKILYPRSYEPEQNEEDEADFWKHFDTISSYCQEAVKSGNGMLLSYSG